MSFLRYLIFFCVFHLLIIINLANSSCPSNFQCGTLGTLEFPLSDRIGCGLFLVQNCSANPVIQFGANGPWYSIVQILSPNRFLILDPLLHEHLTQHFCLGVRNLSLSLPQTPSSSFSVYPNLTVFTCVNQTYSEPIHEYFEHYNHDSCTPFDAYYRNSGTSVPVSDIPLNCSVIHVPIKSNHFSGNLSTLLSPEFVIEWNVSEACYECHHGGGKCLTNSMNGFHCDRGNRTLRKIIFIGGVTMATLTFTFLLIFLFIRRDYTLLKFLNLRKSKNGKELDIELFLKDHKNLAPKGYKYSHLKKITKSFGEKLGEGGYGSVYKGKLPDGRLVAVKILKDPKGNGEEFMNEVASISRTSHVNVVTLLGFCFEGFKRALIYDFMHNGSLEKYIHNNSTSSLIEVKLGWGKLFDIALGIARGLEYLHQGCNTRILHFDIKPHNILLDHDFNPKISDFGLAKLCPNRSSIVSMLLARGTIGYIAPEVFCRNFGDVSYKSDVYSYGMMVLEIAGGKKKIHHRDGDRTSETYFPEYIYKELEKESGGMDGIVNKDERQFAKRKLIIVGLWCIQTHPKDRPSMSKVVEMLEGKIESLQVPPKPYLSSPPRSTLDLNFSTSESM